MTLPDVIVVIPVHDEEELLGRCLASVDSSAAIARRCGVNVQIIVVLDACTDASAVVAGQFDVELVHVEANSVGAARRAGIAHALDDVVPGRLARTWLANTDADSEVPRHWIGHQVSLAERGVDLMLGTVQPDFADLSEEHVALWLSSHMPGLPNGHVHGANLGIRATTYLEAGGFFEVAEHEDVMLCDRIRAIGAAIVASDDAQVITSGRFVGRTPGGYARHLRDQSASLTERELA